MLQLFKKNKPLLDPGEQELIIQAIQEAEQTTSGEVRVFVESHCSYVDAMDRAKEIFLKLKMTETALRNGVLIYVALTDRQVAIFGDEGIYQKTGGASYWQSILTQMRQTFKEGAIAKGIADTARQIGNALTVHFPYNQQTDKNELPDDIVFGK